jgi:hypothetical protein
VPLRAPDPFKTLSPVHRIDDLQRGSEFALPLEEKVMAPEGGLAIGDVLLAQKIALETMERKALAVANSQTVRP